MYVSQSVIIATLVLMWLLIPADLGVAAPLDLQVTVSGPCTPHACILAAL